MWQNEDFKHIMNGQLTVINRKELIGNNNISVLLKSFVESDIHRHNAFSDPLIRKYGTYVCTGKELCTNFGLSFSNLSELRKEKANNILLETIEEKIVGLDKETTKLIKDTVLSFAKNDERLNSLIPTEQLELFN